MNSLRTKLLAVTFALVSLRLAPSVYSNDKAATPQPLSKAPIEWDYLSAYGGQGSWQIWRMKASVRREGATYVIEAYDDLGQLAERITGEVSNGTFEHSKGSG